MSGTIRRTPASRHGPRQRLTAAWALLGLSFALCGSHAGAEVRGLVIGIDDYERLRPLQGAVNDAEDIRDALDGLGAEDVTLLIDGDATRKRIVDEWQSLLSRAEPGDTLVLTYAGHGGQEKERVPGSEEDGKDEVLLLGGFHSSGEKTRERIIDDEIHQWLLDAGRKELRVVFVADACHAGTLTRTVDPRAPETTYRYTRYDLTQDMLKLALPMKTFDTGRIGEDELAHVNFLGAAQEHQKVPEITVRAEDGQPVRRGALSYLFARALRGEADLDGNGALRRDELWRFVRENVRMNSEARQDPNLLPNTRGSETVLALTPASKQSAEGTAGTGAATHSDRFRLAVRQADPQVVERVRATLPDVPIESDKDAFANLIWDADRRQVVSEMGDVIAHDIGVAELRGVVDKWVAVRAVRNLSARASLRLRIDSGDGIHREGDRIGLRIDGRAHPRLTVFSLSGNGAVHYLYPQARFGDPAEIPAGTAFELNDIGVEGPFGADHVVAVSAATSLDSLNAALSRLSCTSMPCRPAAREAAELLAEAAARARGWSSGILGLYTGPRED